MTDTDTALKETFIGDGLFVSYDGFVDAASATRARRPHRRFGAVRVRGIHGVRAAVREEEVTNNKLEKRVAVALHNGNDHQANMAAVYAAYDRDLTESWRRS